MKKKLLGIFGALVITMSTLSVSGGVAHAGDFDNLDVPQIIPNAYKKATEKVDSGKKAGEVAKKLNEDAGNAIQGGAQEAENNINDKMKEIMQAAGWTGPTLMVGQISGSIFDIFNATNSTVNLSKDEQEAWKSRGYDMTSYQAFGEALTNLRSQSWDRSPTELGGGAVVDGVTQAATALSTAGIKFLQKFNPAPILAAFYNDSYLNDSRFGGGKNKFVQIINNSPQMKEAISFFGGQTSAGVSMGFLITGTILILSIGYSALNILFANNHNNAGMTLRRIVWKIVLLSVALPLSAILLTEGLTTFGDLLESKEKFSDNKILSQNLNFADWYHSDFKIPSGVTVEVDGSGKFKFTPDAVSKINYSSSRTVLKNGSSSTEEIADRLVDMAQKDGNRTTIVFNPMVKDDKKVSKAPFTKFADKLVSSGAKKESDKDKDKDKSKDKDGPITESPYITQKGTEASGRTFIGNSNGISPLAAYNFMVTDFTKNGAKVRTNIGQVDFPSIAIGVNDDVVDEKGGAQAPTLIRFIAMLTIMLTAIKVMVGIISGGMGALFRGGVGSSLGSSRAVGEVAGGIIALTLGVFGLSLILQLTLTVVDILWDVIKSIIGGGQYDVVGEVLKPITDKLRSIWIIGPMLAGILTSIANAVVTLVAMMSLPKMLKVPVEGYGAWIQGLPDAIGDRVQMWENNWVGDYRSSGKNWSKIGQNTKIGEKMRQDKHDRMNSKKERSKERSRQVKNAMSLAKGAAMTKLGSAIAGINPADASLAEDPNNVDMSSQLNEGSDLRSSKGDEKHDNSAKSADQMTNTENVSNDQKDTSLSNEEIRENIDNDETIEAADDVNPGSSLSGDTDYGLSHDGSDSLNGHTDSHTEGASTFNNTDRDHHSRDVNHNDSLRNDATHSDSLRNDATNNTDRSSQMDKERQKDTTLSKDANREQLAGAAAASLAGNAYSDSKNINANSSINNQTEGNTNTNVKNNQSLNSQNRTANNFKQGDKKDNMNVTGGNTSQENKSLAQSKSQTQVNNSKTAQSLGKPSSTPVANPATKPVDKPLTKPNTQPGEQKTPGRFRRAVGGALMTAGGHTTGKQARAGLMHAAASSVGMGRFTQNMAQSAVDQRNDNLVANGMRVTDNINFMGPDNREQSERRAESRLKGRGIIQSNGQFTNVHQERLNAQGNRSTYKNYANSGRQGSTQDGLIGSSTKSKSTTTSSTTSSRSSQRSSSTKRS